MYYTIKQDADGRICFETTEGEKWHGFEQSIKDDGIQWMVRTGTRYILDFNKNNNLKLGKLNGIVIIDYPINDHLSFIMFHSLQYT